MSHNLETILEVHLNQRSGVYRTNMQRKQALRSLIENMQVCGEEFLTYKFVMDWLEKSYSHYSASGISDRYSYARLFSEWANSFDKRHQVLPTKSLARKKRTPNILTQAEVSRLMGHLSNEPSPSNFNGFSSSIITGLIYVTGLRKGEALGLQREDINFDQSTVFVPVGKSMNERYIPISNSTAKVLRNYIRMRNAKFPDIKNPFFLFDRGVAKTSKPFSEIFRKVCTRENIMDTSLADIRENPLRPHDLRHSFAVNSLIKCYEEHRDVNEEASKLSILLGHATLNETKWYIEGIPRLIELAMKSKERGS